MPDLRRPAAAAASVALLLALAGCSSSAGGASTPAPVETIDASAVPTAVPADPAAPVAPGEWALVFDDTIHRGQSFAYRVASVSKGDAGDFADTRTQSGAENERLADAVPYYIALEFAAVSGDEADVQSVSAFSVTDESVSTVSVPAELRRCDPTETDALPTAFGQVQVRCIVALATDGAAPTRLAIRGSTSAKDADIRDVATLRLPPAA